ncbi:MAG: ABC transporter substrate-binding protein [Candidatus Bipolaricaulia bacterium]
MRTLSALLFWVVMAVLLGVGVFAQEPVVLINYWHSYGGEFGKAHEALIERFNREHPGIQVRYSYNGSPFTMRDKLLVAIATETAPDAVAIEDYWTPQLAAADAIVKPGDLSAGTAALDDLFPPFLESARYAGEVWAVPYAASSLVLYYNKDLFREVGLDPEAPPHTWEELVQIGKRLTVDRDGDGRIDRWGLSFPLTTQRGVVYYWIPFLWQGGGELFNVDYTETRFASSAGVRALQFWMDLIYKHEIVPLSPPPGGFESGTVAMVLASSARLNIIYKPRVPFELGVAPLPRGRYQSTILGGKHLAILTRDRTKQEAAWTFVRWMTDTERSLEWSMTTGYMSPRSSVIASERFRTYLDEEPRAGVSIDGISYTRPRPNTPAYTDVSRVLAMAIERALFGRENPQQVLEEAARESDRILRATQPPEG